MCLLLDEDFFFDFLSEVTWEDILEEESACIISFCKSCVFFSRSFFRASIYIIQCSGFIHYHSRSWIIMSYLVSLVRFSIPFLIQPSRFPLLLLVQVFYHIIDIIAPSVVARAPHHKQMFWLLPCWDLHVVFQVSQQCRNNVPIILLVTISGRTIGLGAVAQSLGNYQ